MYRQNALWLGAFGSFILLFILLAHNRAAKGDKEWDGDSKMLAEARKARRATLIVSLIVAIGSWIIGGVIYAQGIDIDKFLYPRSFHFYATSFVLVTGAVSYLSFEWILHKLAKRVASSGHADLELVQTYEKAKTMRWKVLMTWVLMSVIMLLG
jgi:lysylphosphatidylglycerol synthetase-like protein (DUF2156 family)